MSGELVTAALLNTHLRDNLNMLARTDAANTFTQEQAITESANAAVGLTITNTNTGTSAVAGHDVAADKVALDIRSFGSGFTQYTRAGVTMTQGSELFVATAAGTGPANLLIGLDTNNPIYLVTNNTLRVTLSGAGLMRWHAYGAGTLTTDASGNITAVSDGRLKTICGPLEYGLAELIQLSAVRYRWKPETGMDIEHEYAGFDARAVAPVMPLAAPYNTDRDEYTLSDRVILGALVNAIKEMARRLDIIEAA